MIVGGDLCSAAYFDFTDEGGSGSYVYVVAKDGHTLTPHG